MIEYVRWYLPATELMRCLECGAVVGSGDIEVHTAWHERNED